jgi:hypothetical protein
MSNFGERVLEKLHLRRHIEKVEVDAPGAEVKIKEHPVDQVTPPVSEPADNPKVKVHVKGAPGVKEKVKRPPVPSSSALLHSSDAYLPGVGSASVTPRPICMNKARAFCHMNRTMALRRRSLHSLAHAWCR